MFEWNYGRFEQRIQNEKEEDRKYFFHIQITTPYKWGNGWETESDSRIYEEQLRDSLNTQGYEQTTIKDGNNGTCTQIRDDKGIALGNYCYMHPMDWSGYGTKQFIEDMQKVLQGMECVTYINEPNDVKRILPLKPYEYEEMLLDNMDELLRFFKEEVPSRRYTDAGILFAEKYRPNILLDTKYATQSIASDNIDVKLVNNLYSMYKFMNVNGLIDKKGMTTMFIKMDEEKELDKNLGDDTYER